MRKLSATQARREWSKLLAAVEAGEPIIITRYGKPVAQLVPPGVAARLPDAARLRASVPPMRESAGDFIRKLRDDERF